MDNSTIKALVQTMYDYQNNRIRTANRLSLRKDGTKQNKDEAIIEKTELPIINIVLGQSKNLEHRIFLEIQHELKNWPIYNDWIKDVKGCGPATAAVLIATIDIHKATTVSKIWQYAGLNPSFVKGKKIRSEDGKRVLYETEELVRGDRLTAGFVAPYNSFLKSKLLGVLADCFIKSKSPYAEFYYNMKKRLANSEKPVNGNSDKMWKDEKPIHREKAAKRYMIKMFLRDLYVAWRTLEGLEVRVPYEEQYLGIVHHA